MKRLIISAALLLSCLALSAAVVSENQARTYAEKFFSNGKQAATVTSSELLFGTKASLTEPAYYVFNNPDGGWVIIAAEDAVNPVLAYSETGSFKADGMPSNLQFWMSGIRDNINSARKDGLKRTTTVERAWQCIGEKTKAASTKTIETALWNQDDPYNQLCPKNSGESKRSVTGCVATAMAIVLRHNEWPETGTGTIPSYKTETYETTVDAININGYQYSWSDMPMTDGGSTSWTSAQKTAVATLMKHCGAMVQMDYTYSEGSGAYSADVAPALKTYMSYSKQAEEIYRYSMSLGDWFYKIKSEIDNSRPLIYGAGDASGGGHQFVCDGYDEDNCKLHINWGWGGADNGFFTLDLAIPQSYTFDQYQAAIFNLIPDKTGTSTDVAVKLDLADYSSYYSDLPYKGVELSSGTVAKGNKVTFTVGTIENLGSAKYSGKLKLALVRFDGTVKQTIAEKSLTLESGYVSATSLSGTITSDIAPGDFITVYYTIDGEYTILPWDSECGTMMGAYGAGDERIIRLKNSYTAGDRFDLDIRSITPGQKITSSVTWYVNGSKCSDAYIILSAGTTTLKAVITYSDNTTETVSAKIII